MMTLFDTLGGILREFDPRDGRAGVTAGRKRWPVLCPARHPDVRISPLRLPQELPFMELVHGDDERIPVDSLEFGTTAIRRLLERFGQVTEFAGHD